MHFYAYSVHYYSNITLALSVNIKKISAALSVDNVRINLLSINLAYWLLARSFGQVVSSFGYLSSKFVFFLSPYYSIATRSRRIDK